MSQDERQHWDALYADGTYVARSEPSPFLVGWLAQIPVGRALDVACGTGRHALELVDAGFQVDAVDISEVALTVGRAEAAARGLDSTRWIAADLDEGDLPGDAYDLITVLRYRNPDLWPRLREALAPNGWVVIEHHLRTSADVGGPSSESFRLVPGELLDAFAGLRILHYSERLEPADMGRQEQFAIARLVAVNGDPGF